LVVSDLQQTLTHLILSSWESSDSSGVSSSAFERLCEAQYEPAVCFFADLLQHPRVAWREQAIQALFEFKQLHEMVLNKVRSVLLNDESEFARLWAVRVIARHGVWYESALVRALKVETAPLVRAEVFQTILELQGLPKGTPDRIYDLVLARTIEGTFEQAQDFVAQWKAQQAAIKAAFFKQRRTLYKLAILKTKPKLVYPRFQTFHSDLVKGEPLSARGVELLKTNTSQEHGLNEYLEFVAQVGLCNVGNGFLCLVDPADYEREVNVMFPSQDAVVFARTSLGWLYVVTRAAMFEVSPFHGEYASWINVDFEYFFDLMSKPDTLEHMGLVTHQELLESLGSLEVHECYGSEPRVEHYGDEIDEKLEVHAHLRFLLALKPMRRLAELLN
jgi:hypothetical protein